MRIKEAIEASKTLQPGVGGNKCPCCNPFGCSPRIMKPLARRIERRAMNQKLRNELKSFV